MHIFFAKKETRETEHAAKTLYLRMCGTSIVHPSIFDGLWQNLFSAPPLFAAILFCLHIGQILHFSRKSVTTCEDKKLFQEKFVLIPRQSLTLPVF